MLHAVCLSLFSCLPQGEVQREVDPAAAAERIEVGIKAGPGPAVDNLDVYGDIAHPAVTKAVAHGLLEEDIRVQRAAIDALRFNEDKSALRELLRVRSRKEIIEHGELAGPYYLALGHKLEARDRATQRILTRAIENLRTPDRGRGAAVLALARAPSRANVDFLIRFFRTGRAARRAWSEGQLALKVMTGTDQGRRHSDWAKWWDDHRRRYTAPEGLDHLDERARRSWDRSWQKLDGKGRKERRSKERSRETRGKDSKRRKAEKDGDKGRSKLGR